MGALEGPAIIVTGHSLRALDELLRQTEDTGINVYTHSELLLAHGTLNQKVPPPCRSAWRSMVRSEENLLTIYTAATRTSNCVLLPADDYRDRMSPVELQGFRSVRHLEDYDFKPLIDRALELPPSVRKMQDAYNGLRTLNYTLTCR